MIGKGLSKTMLKPYLKTCWRFILILLMILWIPLMIILGIYITDAIVFANIIIDNIPFVVGRGDTSEATRYILGFWMSAMLIVGSLIFYFQKNLYKRMPRYVISLLLPIGSFIKSKYYDAYFYTIEPIKEYKRLPKSTPEGSLSRCKQDGGLSLCESDQESEHFKKFGFELPKIRIITESGKQIQ